MSFILQTRGLSFVYGKGTPFERRALDGVNLNIERGSFTGIIGHTGSGKSTLIQQLNGLLRPDAGEVLLEGVNIQKIPNIRFRIGLVFQFPEYQLFEETVRRDVAFGPSNMGISGAELEARVDRALEFVGLPPDIGERSPFELSGGQKRRAAIAGVIAMEPEVLILDEPTAGLDPAGCADILRHIQEYHRSRRCTVILVTHSMEDAARSSDRIVVMSRGGILMEGRPAEIFSRADTLRSAGLSAPGVTRVLLRLRELGLDVDTSAYTAAQAADKIMEAAGIC